MNSVTVLGGRFWRLQKGAQPVMKTASLFYSPEQLTSKAAFSQSSHYNCNFNHEGRVWRLQNKDDSENIFEGDCKLGGRFWRLQNTDDFLNSLCKDLRHKGRFWRLQNTDEYMKS